MNSFKPTTQEILACLHNIEMTFEDNYTLWDIHAEEGPLARNLPPIHARTIAGAFYRAYKYILTRYSLEKKRIGRQKIIVPFDIIDIHEWDLYLEVAGEPGTPEGPSTDNFVEWILESTSGSSMCRM
jgi:hypothetical protein